MRLVQLFILLISAINVSALVKVGFQFTGNSKLIFNPARTHMFVKHAANTDNNTVHTPHTVIYPDKYGDFNIPNDLTTINTTLELTIESLDYLFSSPHFSLNIPYNASTNTSITQKDALHLKLEYPTTTNITTPVTHLILQSSQYGFYPLRFMPTDSVKVSPMQMMRSIPFLAPIVSSKWTIGIFILLISLAAIPYVINYLDPSFADRMLQAQIDQQNTEKENKDT
ncbi:hypothetical protein CANINC_000642 [Pichia inconspicua]|uniref:Protein SOP4 n=1 Tax=Pichia inconspicua TaxID=52247 RepID=A0A4T0X5H5_9ASCO|nr:hypothetical protein CANINC_000642 [[Candida] inconspicua]